MPERTGSMRTRSIHKAALTDAVTSLEESGKKLAYKAAVEGIVLLENDGSLPLKAGKIALYGAGAKKTIKGGTGSGEVNERHAVSVLKDWNNQDLQLLLCGGSKIMTRHSKRVNRNMQKNSGKTKSKELVRFYEPDEQSI